MNKLVWKIIATALDNQASVYGPFYSEGDALNWARSFVKQSYSIVEIVQVKTAFINPKEEDLLNGRVKAARSA